MRIVLGTFVVLASIGVAMAVYVLYEAWVVWKSRRRISR